MWAWLRLNLTKEKHSKAGNLRRADFFVMLKILTMNDIFNGVFFYIDISLCTTLFRYPIKISGKYHVIWLLFWAPYKVPAINTPIRSAVIAGSTHLDPSVLSRAFQKVDNIIYLMNFLGKYVILKFYIF